MTRSSTKQRQAASMILDEKTEERLRTIAYGDLSGKVIHEDLAVEEVSAAKRLWKRVLGQSNQAELLEVARCLQKLSTACELSEDQEKLVGAAKERVRELAATWTNRADLQKTIFAQFDGSKELERVEFEDFTHAQGLVVSDSGAVMNQVENTPPHHPNAGYHMDHGRVCYYDNGGLSLVFAEGARDGGVGNALCAKEFSGSVLNQLASVVSDKDLDEKRVKQILQNATKELSKNYKGDRAESAGQKICMGRTAFLLAKTFPSEYPDRVEVKCVQLGYMALFYRHHATGQIFPLTRAQRGKAGSAEDKEYRDSTTRFFNPEDEVNSYWDWIHFNEALVPMDGHFVALTSRALDNILDLAAFEMIIASPVFNNEIQGPTPWASLPTARQVKRYNEINGNYSDSPAEVSAELVATRLQHYTVLMSRNNLVMNEEIFELVSSRRHLRNQWDKMLEEGTLSQSQLNDLMCGKSVVGSHGTRVDASEMQRLELEVDKLLEDLEAIPGRAGDFLVGAVPVYLQTSDSKVNSFVQTLRTFFGA